MHEVIGHASGQQAAGFKGTPQQAIKEHFSALEEGRADLVGLYYLADPKLVELGVIPAADQDNIVRAEYEGYTRNALVQLRRVREGTHDRGRPHAQPPDDRPVADGQHEGDRTADARRQDVSDDGRSEGVPRRRRDSCSPKCSASSQKATTPRPRSCSTPTASTSIRSCATKSCARGQAEPAVLHRASCMPKLTPVMGADGKITDVKISYPLDLTTQMLEYDGVVKR